MRLIQSYKIILLILLSSTFLLSEHIKPFSYRQEERIDLVIDTDKGKKERSYYLVDDDGLLFKSKDFLKEGFSLGDKINLQIMSRTYLASSNDNRKKFQFTVTIKKKNKVLLDRELTYNKKISSATSPEHKKGFSFTYAGYWFEDVKLTSDLEIHIKPIEGVKQKVYMRLISRENKETKKIKNKISPIDYQKNITVSESGENKKKDWYLITENNKQQFKLESNKKYQVLTRLVLDNLEQENNIEEYYELIAYENNQKLANYIMEGNLSTTNTSIESDYENLSGKFLSKYSSFFISVPGSNKKYSYYTFKLPRDDQRKVLIKILGYESKE